MPFVIIGGIATLIIGMIALKYIINSKCEPNLSVEQRIHNQSLNQNQLILQPPNEPIPPKYEEINGVNGVNGVIDQPPEY